MIDSKRLEALKSEKEAWDKNPTCHVCGASLESEEDPFCSEECLKMHKECEAYLKQSWENQG